MIKFLCTDMKSAFIMSLLAASFIGTPKASSVTVQKPDPEKDPERIKKRLFVAWKIVSGEDKGVPLKKDDLDFSFEFSAEETWFQEVAGEFSGQWIGKPVLDVKASPMRLDLHLYETLIKPNRTRVTPGIFKFDGDNLIYVYSSTVDLDPDSKYPTRPTEFKSTKTNGCSIRVLKPYKAP